MAKSFTYCLLVLLPLLLTLLEVKGNSGASAANGLLFKSYNYPHHERTSLDICQDRVFSPSKSQQLSFELSFWEAIKFGYIFRAHTLSNDKLDLIFLPEDLSLKLVFRHQGRRYRLTDVSGKLVKGIMS